MYGNAHLFARTLVCLIKCQLVNCLFIIMLGFVFVFFCCFIMLVCDRLLAAKMQKIYFSSL